MINIKNIISSAIALYVGVISASAHAQLNLPNPLIEPLSRQNRAAPGNAPGSSMAGLPPLPAGAQSRAPMVSASSIESVESRKDTDLTSARTQFNGFSVAAIIGKKAVLRRQTSAAASSGSQMANGQIPLSGQSNSAASPSSTSGLRSESLTVVDGEVFDYTTGNGSLYASVKGDRVVIYLDHGDGKNSIRKDVVFAGEMQSTISQPRSITLQTKDSDYKQSLNVKANNSTSSSNGDSGSNQNSNSPSNQSGSNQGT